MVFSFKKVIFVSINYKIIMKAAFFTSVLSFLLLLLGSCGDNPTGIKATGVFFDIVVVANPSTWDDIAGDLLKAELTAPVPGLPQDESSMRITYVPASEFRGMLTYVRNILIVNIDNTLYTKVTLRSERNRWSVGQAVVSITSPDEPTLIDYLFANKGKIVEYFTKEEMRRMAEILQTTYSIPAMEILKSRFNVMLNMPTDMRHFNKDSTDFFWTSNNAIRGRMDMVVYSFPYTDPQTFTREYMIAMRDSVLSANIPGSFPNSYMLTEVVYSTPMYTPISMYGKYCGVLRGLWQMEGDMMGGPFVSFARLDETNNRVVVAEGFVYAPESDKKNYMRRLEASLHTLRLPGEYEMTLDGPVINE